MSAPLAARRTLAQVLAILLALPVARLAAAQQPEPTRFGGWAEFGVGYGRLYAAPGPAPASDGGMWLEAQLGVRIGSRWRTGFELGGIGIRYANSNDTADYQSVWGQGITHELLVVEYTQRRDRGWYAGIGAGGLLYDNRALQDVTHDERSGNGWAALGRVGYEWSFGGRAHAGVDLNLERGDVRLNAPLSGHFGVSMIAADIHLSYH
jgi:hypothetical protein